MGKWISILFQVYLWQKNINRSNEMLEIAQRSIHKTKGYAISTAVSLFAIFFMLTSIVVFVVECGLQIESESFIHFSGLFVSALIFFVISLLLFLLGIIPIWKNSEPPKPQKTEPFSAESLYPLAEEFLKQVIGNLANKPKKGA